MYMSSLNQVHCLMITESDPVVHTRQAYYTKLPLQIAPVTYVCFVTFFAPLMELSDIYAVLACCLFVMSV